MEHPSTNTLRRVFSHLGKQDKEEIHRNLQAFASSLHIRVDANFLYLNERTNDMAFPLTSIHAILIANGCFYIQFGFDRSGILAIELDANKRELISLRQKRRGIPKMYDELVYRARLAKRSFRYFYIKLLRRFRYTLK